MNIFLPTSPKVFRNPSDAFHRILLVLTLFLAAFLVNCQSKGSENSNVNRAARPTASPTPTEEERERKSKELEVAKTKAIQEFIDSHYKGFAVQGVASGFADGQCYEDEPCDVQIAKGTETKVISIMVKQFRRPDGTTYWYAFESRPIDLSKSKIEKIKERERDATLENLDIDNCRKICDETRDSLDDYGYSPAYEDPRS